MEKRILLLITYVCYFLILIFSIRLVDEFLEVKQYKDAFAKMEYDREGNSFWYYMVTDGGRRLETNKIDVESHNIGDSIHLYQSTIFKELVGWKSFPTKKFGVLMHGNLKRPSEINLILDFIILALGAFAVFVTRKFEFRAVALFFAVIAAALRWWFVSMP